MATKEDGKRGALIANYVWPNADGTSLTNLSENDGSNIHQCLHNEIGEDFPYDLVNCGAPDRQFKVWEAARATTAIPGLFEHFKHANQQVYLGGPAFCTDTARVALQEAYRLWPVLHQRHPDLLLSIGARQPEGPVQTDPPPGDCYIRLNTEPPNSSFQPDEMTAFNIADLETDMEPFPETFNDAVDAIVDRLISTSFYFELSHEPYEEKPGRVRVQGMVPHNRSFKEKMAMRIY